jgi:hypothetical protein
MRIVWGRSLGFNIELNKMSFNGAGKLQPGGMLITQRIFDGPDCYSWRQVFALWPVKTVSGKYVWLRKIYKRKFWVVWGTGFHMEPHVEYGTLFDMINYE